MMPYLLSMFGSAVLIACAIQLVRELTNTRRVPWLPTAALTLSLLPVGELTLGRWIHSFTGFLSLPLVLLLASYSVKPLLIQFSTERVRDHTIYRRYWWLMTIVGCLYYPASLGWGDVDPHALGWQPDFIWIPIAISIVLLSLGDYWLAGMITASMLAWQYSLLGSSNGWSYLLDPVAVGLSILGLAATTLKNVWKRLQTIGQPTANPTESIVVAASKAA
jgi:hypothetical protein